jgi:hypothetical protein
MAGRRPILEPVPSIITLSLAVLGAVTVPSRPVEVLIAVSILVSAAHALRPIFPGKEA